MQCSEWEKLNDSSMSWVDCFKDGGSLINET